MELFEKAKAWAKAKPKLAIFVAFVVVAVIANLLGFG